MPNFAPEKEEKTSTLFCIQHESGGTLSKKHTNMVVVHVMEDGHLPELWSQVRPSEQLKHLYMPDH